MRGAPGEDYERVNEPDLQDGQTVIVERLKFEYKHGYPIDSDYFRAIVGHHSTVSGLRAHLVNEPDVYFPQIAPWQSRWIYAGNDGNHQMWRKKK